MIKQIKKATFMLYMLIIVVALFSCEETEEPVVLNESIIQLNVLDESLANQITEVLGDGTTIIALQVKIPHNAADKFKAITFKASKGTFVNSTVNPMELTKKVNSEGVATVYLKVPLDHGELFVSAQTGSTIDSTFYADDKVVNLINVGEILNFELLDNKLQPLVQPVKADGNTIIVLKAKVNFNATSLNAINFLNSAGSGSFLDVTNLTNITLDSNNNAFIRFKVSKTVGEIYFRAEISTNPQIYKTSGLTLTRSFADNIVLDPDVLIVDSPSATVNLITYLLKDTGSVSTGTGVQYEAYQLNDSNVQVPVGRFTGLPQAFTDTEGKITGVNFKPDTGDVDFKQPIIIRVFSRNDNNMQITQTVTLNKL